MTLEQQNRLLLAKIIGELYRMQLRTSIPCQARDARIYGLLKGFEQVIDEELEHIGFVSKKQVDHVINVLKPFWKDPEKLSKFKGFYDIEDALETGGVDRMTAAKILTYLNADMRFKEVIAKMDSSDSPVECKTFELDDWYK